MAKHRSVAWGGIFMEYSGWVSLFTMLQESHVEKLKAQFIPTLLAVTTTILHLARFPSPNWTYYDVPVPCTEIYFAAMDITYIKYLHCTFLITPYRLIHAMISCTDYVSRTRTVLGNRAGFARHTFATSR